jgi:hypothetical protein
MYSRLDVHAVRGCAGGYSARDTTKKTKGEKTMTEEKPICKKCKKNPVLYFKGAGENGEDLPSNVCKECFDKDNVKANKKMFLEDSDEEDEDEDGEG